MPDLSAPLPLFDTLANFAEAAAPDLSSLREFCITDYSHAHAFLTTYPMDTLYAFHAFFAISF